MLIQAQPQDHKAGKDTLHAEALKTELLTNHQIPAEEIAIATGSQRGLEGVDLFAKECRIKYIITQQALAEGWDCSFAYVLASVAETQSAKVVEQLLGRVLRMPYAQSRRTPALNRAYAFIASDRFFETANNLRDALVHCAGFEKKDAAEFITAARMEQMPLGISGTDRRCTPAPVEVTLPERPDIEQLSPGIQEKVRWDPKTQKLTLKTPLETEEAEALKALMLMDSGREDIDRANQQIKAQTAEIFRTPSERGLDFRVPHMAVLVNGELQLFDDPEVLDYPWTLPLQEAQASPQESAALGLAGREGDSGQIDLTGDQLTVERFISNLHQELALAYQPEHVTEARLAGWLCRNVIDPYTDQPSLMAFISAWLGDLLSNRGFTLVTANTLKFTLRSLLQKRLRQMRDQSKREAYQLALFGEERRERVSVGAGFDFEFHPDAYSPGEIYPRSAEMRHHYYPQVGKLDTGEEEKCAWHLEQLCGQGKLAFWVRNLVRKGSASFYLQKATDRFYPDFLARLPDGRTLVVESKGAHLWEASEDDRRIGQLWEEMSGGRCLFIMITAGQLGMIDLKLKPAV